MPGAKAKRAEVVADINRVPPLPDRIVRPPPLVLPVPPVHHRPSSPSPMNNNSRMMIFRFKKLLVGSC
jgi:hypothetical protein